MMKIDKNIEKFVVVVPNIRSAHNVGAILRTADGAGIDKVYITGYSPYPPHPGLLKVSLGAENFVKWEYNKIPISRIGILTVFC